jgi:membrane associated rhomboid family serine protease
MLILPLHRPLTRATFPFVTALLILLNVAVFVLFQAGDGPAIQAAQSHYVDSGLGALEAPAYETWLERAGRSEELRGLRVASAEARVAYVAQQTFTDVAFVEALQGGSLFEDEETFERWRQLRPRYDELRDEVFTLRHILRSSEIDPWRMLASAFLHGGLGHLVGNMIFLGALGLLVEGALGAGRFAAVYLLGALGSSAVSLWWRWGEAGGGLGASGAIAALMGAFCLVYGRQPVRFFYWFGVVFDYVRAPAIWLFPVWLGWEVWNLFAHPDLGIGFDAHAGGLVTGALLGSALVAMQQVREDFIEDAPATAADDRWARAQAHLGRMELLEADRLLQELQAETPRRFDVALARQRVARNGGQALARRERALDLLRLEAPDVQAAAQQSEVLRNEPGLALDAATRQALTRHWLELDVPDATESMLQSAPDDDATAQGLFQLGLYRERQRQPEAFERALGALLQRFPQHVLAQKARFLLAHR